MLIKVQFRGLELYKKRGELYIYNVPFQFEVVYDHVQMSSFMKIYDLTMASPVLNQNQTREFAQSGRESVTKVLIVSVVTRLSF